MKDLDDLEFQTWICPKCYDDHAPGAPCTVRANSGEIFMPHVSDQSYIADQYRERVAEFKRLKRLVWDYYYTRDPEAAKGIEDFIKGVDDGNHSRR